MTTGLRGIARPLAFAVAGVLCVAGCGKKPPSDWRRQVSAEDATAIVARCLPGATLDPKRDFRVKQIWRLSEPGPEERSTFTLVLSFEWKDSTRAGLYQIDVRAYGPKEQKTPQHGQAYRALVECAVSPEIVPQRARAGLLNLLSTLSPPGRLDALIDGFGVEVSQSQDAKTFFANATVFLPRHMP